MPNLSLVAGVAIVLTSLTRALPVTAEPAKKLELPPSERGEIGGQPAILLWPIEDGPGPGIDRLIDPTGCQVQVINDDTDDEFVRPCGQWFVVAVGKYTAWLESTDWISTAPTVFHNGGGAFKGHGTRVLVPVVPAGVVKVSSPLATGATTIRLLSLDGNGYAFQRNISPAKAAAGVRMPARRAIAGVFGPSGEALALSHPFDVSTRGTVAVTPAAPAKGSAILAVLTRPVGPHGYSQSPATFELEDAAGRHAPDVVLSDPARFYLIWYEARGSSATVRVAPGEFRLNHGELVLQSGRFTTLRSDLSFESAGTSPTTR
jgi:hypothetical protein